MPLVYAVVGPKGMAMSVRTIKILDTTLRDGEQSAGVCFSPDDKLEIARMLEALRVDVIEAGFPAASTTEAAAVRGVARAIKDSSICALARAVTGDIDQAWQSIRDAVDPRIHIFLSASKQHIEHQLKSTRSKIIAQTRAALVHAGRYTDNVQFSPMDATRSDPIFLAEIVRTAIRAGARIINIPDTVGAAIPLSIERLFERLYADVPELGEVEVSFHGQNDLGLATANALAATIAGASQIETTVNGIGERAGNTALEEVVMALRIHHQNIGAITRIKSRHLYAASQLVETRSGLAVSPNKAVVGGNMFRHASGIHQDGVLKQRENYEVIDPDWIGHPRGTEVVLGKLSGRSGFESRVRSLGIQLSPQGLDVAFGRFQKHADVCQETDNDELRVICIIAEAWPGPGV